ncbi:2-hydroxychromene-2-carboxylate isomerase [Apiospora kogelbergensis]|uniref:Glutathione S-transferase kappa n=1 Tax=Apiospora kogelbergensis TaxID=1337665 RepID=A0AAW0R630_9PEZI
MVAPSIRLYVDVVSPFAYQAFHILRHDPVFKGVHVEYIPIFLGGLMHACGNTAPIQIKNKDKWIGQERLRWARAFDVPMIDTVPANFPPNTLHTMRAVCALSRLPDDDKQDKLVRGLEALFGAMWTEHAEVARPDVFGPVLVKALGEEVAEKALASAPTAGKTALKENTDQAFADGAFGLPWMVCTNSRGQTEGFWGVDHMGQVLQFMGLERPREGGWKSLL